MARYSHACRAGLGLIAFVLAVSWPGTDRVRAEEAQPVLVPEGEAVPPLMQVRTLSHSSPVNEVAWSPDGKVLASGSDDGMVQLWNPATGKELKRLRGHSSSIWSVAFSSDGMLLASASDDNTVRLWNVASGTALRTLSGHTDSVRSVSFSPDGSLLASASDDNTVRLWYAASGTALRTLSDHRGSVRSVNFSPDGTRLASASDDNTVRLWDVVSGTALRTLNGHTDWVRSVSFSPDGTRLASASDDNTVRLWDVASGTVLRTLGGHTGSVGSVSFSPDGTLLALSDAYTVQLWGVASGTALRTLRRHSGAIRSVRFSPDGTRLASASEDNTVRLWNVAAGTELRTLSGHSYLVWSVSFSPDGTLLASASDDNTVRLWDVASGTERRTLSGHGDSVRSVSFSPDGTLLASASDDNTVRLWDVASGKQLRALSGHGDSVRSVSFSPDGTLLASASADNTVRLWDVASDRALRIFRGHSGAVSSVSFSPDGTLLASASDDNTVRLWNVASNTALRIFRGHSGAVSSLSFNPDGKLLASASDDNTVRLWNVASGTEIRTFRGHSSAVSSVSFSPDGTLLVSASDDNTVRLWDVLTWGNERRTLSGHNLTVRSVSFSPNSTLLASASDDGTVRLWNVASGTEIRTLSSHGSWVLSTSFSPDGTRLASASADNTVRLWDVASGTALHTLRGHSGAVWSVSFSPNGTLLASASNDSSVRLWDVASGMERRTLSGHSGTVWSVSFSPDGTRLASASDDSTVRLWDVASGTTLGTLRGHRKRVRFVSFSPDGKLLASASDDSTVQLWDVASGKEHLSLRGHSDVVWSVSFSPDGTLLASASDDNTVRLWDVNAARAPRILNGHSDAVRSMSFSPDGKLLASASDDNTVRLWDVASDRAPRILSGHSDSIWSVSFRPDGRLLASASTDNTVRLWNVASGTSHMVLQGFRGGAWMAYHASGRLFRGDDGIQPRFVVHDDWDAAPRRLSPPTPDNGEARLEATVLNSAIIQDGKQGAKVRVRIENRGTAPAYWIHLALEGSLPAGFTAAEQGFRSRLDPGDSAEIPVFVAYTHRLSSAAPERAPETFDSRIGLMVTSASTTSVPVSIPVHVLTPRPRVRESKVLENKADELSVVQVTVENATGGEDPEGLWVSVEFVDRVSGQVLGEAMPQSITGPLAAGVVAAPLSFTVPEAVLDHDGEVDLKVRMSDGIWPTHRWTSRHPLALGWSWLYLALALAAGLLLIAAVLYQLVFRHPLVLRLAHEPEALRAMRASAAPAADRTLRRARRLAPLLADVDIAPERWHKLARTGATPAVALAEALRAELGPGSTPESGIAVHPIKLPRLPIPIKPETALVDVHGEPPADLRDLLDKLIAERNLQGRYLLLLDRTAAGDLASQLAQVPLKLAVLDERDVTAVALAPRPIEMLCQIIARTVRLGDISPYQTSGGLERPEQFFGRQGEIALLGGRDARNHLLIGGRQIGKSSLLKLLHGSNPERILFVTSTGADLDEDLRRKNLPALDAMGPAEPGAPMPMLLIDEADKLVAADRKNDYALCRRLRAMSEEGRCRFILAGFWELHHAAYLEHQSPLRNLAEPISLGPLDERAARDLATQPLATLGLRWASDALVDELLARTGCRPNLIALACDAAIRALPALGKRELGPDELRAVLDMSDESGKAVAQFFSDLGALTDDKRLCRLDRMVLYATVGLESFTFHEVEKRLDRAGAQVPAQELRESIERLILAYVIKKQAGSYVYPVPLVREYLLAETEGAPDEMLALETRDWNRSAAP